MHKEIGRRLEIERYRGRQGDRNKELGRNIRVYGYEKLAKQELSICTILERN